ncbi:MAG: MCE family protein [Deltaproteobacteria bacterium]|nr:MCE family protein [Deltaproteobacteria bacterium]MBW2218132.1 MCE family protein [Deltaproteobacteria bacterium]
MQPNYEKTEKIVGIFIIAISMLLLTTVVFIGRGQNWFRKYVAYYTTFNESYNLQVNAAVKLFKTDIGNVQEIVLVENRVMVKLAILENYANRIRTDTVASVESPTLIGDEYVSIKPGDPNSDPVLPGGEISSVEKKSLTEILEEFEIEKTAKMMIQALQDLSEIVRVLREPDGPLFTALDNTNMILKDVQAGKGSAGSILKSRELVDNVIQRLDQAGDILDNIKTASTKAPETVNHVERILKDVEDNLGKLKIIMSNIEKGSRDVPEITQNTKTGIREIRNGVERIDRVFKALQQNVLIRSNIPSRPDEQNLDAGLRQ